VILPDSSFNIEIRPRRKKAIGARTRIKEACFSSRAECLKNATKSQSPPSEPKTTVMLKAGKLPGSANELFRRVFWKSDFLASQAHSFWCEVKKAEPTGLSIQAWKDWSAEQGMSVGQFYNMIMFLRNVWIMRFWGVLKEHGDTFGF
jgi:hypothetical protein